MESARILQRSFSFLSGKVTAPGQPSCSRDFLRLLCAIARAQQQLDLPGALPSAEPVSSSAQELIPQHSDLGGTTEGLQQDSRRGRPWCLVGTGFQNLKNASVRGYAQAAVQRDRRPKPYQGAVNQSYRRGPPLAKAPPREQAYVPKANPQAKSVVKEVELPQRVTMRQLATLLGAKLDFVQQLLQDLGDEDLQADAVVSRDSAELVALEAGYMVKRSRARFQDAKSSKGAGLATSAAWPSRPAVVTVMGHVDHGKTSLLDALRETSVAAREAGGITQHTGAFVVQMASGATLTFLDTPGHAAFSAMRARGAGLTDVVVLVVAADDGVMPQTREALSHARAANVPIVVAINKCDRAEADPGRVRRQLLEEGLELEEAGGDVQVVEVSATARSGLTALEEAVLLQAELMDLRADTSCEAEAVVVEARLDKGQGPLATVIVRCGVLKPGDYMVVGQQWGRLRALKSTLGESVLEATPSMPVEVHGLRGLPEAGDEVLVVASEERARRVVEGRRLRAEAQKAAQQIARAASGAAASTSAAAAEDSAAAAGEEAKELSVVVKADTQGTAEAVSSAIRALAGPQVGVSVVHAGVGAVSQSDVELAAACDAMLVGFGVRCGGAVEAAAKKAGVELRQHRVIYHLLEDIGAMMVGIAPGTKEERVAGQAEVLAVFEVKGKRGEAATSIAGCRVVSGRLERGGRVRVLRSGTLLYEGPCQSLRREKLSVENVGKGTECGLTLPSWTDYQAGDIIQCLEDVMKPARLVSNKAGQMTVQA